MHGQRALLLAIALLLVALAFSTETESACAKKGGFCVPLLLCERFNGTIAFATACTNRPDSCVIRNNSAPGGTITTVCCLPSQ